jgi:putative DNA-invertase from lambdoid prophage Rac
MIYAYIRVSTEKQTTANQRHEIEQFAQSKHLIISKWIEETISSTRRLEERRLSKVLKLLKPTDKLIVTELSRLGRNLMQIMSILNHCMEKKVTVYAIKEGYELGDNINSKVLAFAFGLAAEIERNLISQRTKESLARLKAEGRQLGRPKGSKKQFPKLAPHAAYISQRLAEGARQIDIARSLKVHRHTVMEWVKQHPQAL